MMNEEQGAAVAAVVMGVSGSGKTTVGQALAERLGWRFLDADAYHGEANVRKMAQGVPLTDADRWPWLRRLRDALAACLRDGASVVLACSALKAAYRDVLREAGPAVRLIYLRGSFDLLQERLENRMDHFFAADLLQSQFDVLEEPADAFHVDVALPPDDIVDRIAAYLEGASSAEDERKHA